MIDELKNNRQVLLEIVLVRHIENYLNFLSGLLFEVFRQRPETLKSSERVELATVLRYESLDTCRRASVQIHSLIKAVEKRMYIFVLLLVRKGIQGFF